MKLKMFAMVALLAVPASASAMPVDAFLARADALQAKGLGALFSSDYKLLKNIIEADGAALRAERAAAQAAKRTPAYCPNGPLNVGQSQVMVAMRQVPTSSRARTDTRDALRSYFARLYPCGR